MIEDWIDNLAKTWAFAVNDFQTVRSIRIIESTDFPASINPAGDFPLAMTMPLGLSASYAASGSVLHWTGETQFHVAPNLENSAMPSLPKWYGKILTAAAGNITLNGKVTNFGIPDESDAIRLEALQYGNEAEHWGFTVRWFVTESARITVA